MDFDAVPGMTVLPFDEEYLRRFERWLTRCGHGAGKIGFDPAYVEFLRRLNGCIPVKRCFETAEGTAHAVDHFGNFAALSAEDCWRIWSIPRMFQHSMRRLGQWLIPVADLEFCDLLCFDYRVSGRPRVVVWFHDMPGPEGMPHTELAAENFDEFLAKLHVGPVTRAARPEPHEIQRLRDAGLRVFSGQSGLKTLSFAIIKPSHVPGNDRGQEQRLVDANGVEILFRGPLTRLYQKEGRWIFESWESAPGPLPGEFRKPYETVGEAVEGLLEYFFGDPTWMNPPERAEFFSKDHFWEMLKKLETIPGSRCKRDGCEKETLLRSVFCAAHHYEMITHNPAPL